MSLILLGLFAAIYFDMLLFKRRDQKLFASIFQISFFKVGIGIFLILAVLLFSKDLGRDMPPLVLLLMFPLYLLRRSRFVKSVISDSGQRQLILLSSALGVIIIWTYGVLVFGLFVSGLMDLSPTAISEMGDLVLSAIFSSTLIIGLIYQSSKNFSDQGFLANVGLHRENQPLVKIVLIPVVLGLFFSFFAAYLAVNRQIQPQTPLNDVLEQTHSVALILTFLFLAIGIAPLVEEIVFRGYFFRVLKEWIGGKKAIYAIALTFAVLHVGQYWGDWMAIGMVTILGFTLTILRAWTGTTIASVVLHYVYNAGVTIIPIIIIAVSNPAYFEYKAYYPYHDAETKEDLLKKSLIAQPDLVEAYNDLAWLYAEEQKNLDEALALVDKALSYAPQHPAYLDTKAEILQKLGREEEARAIRTRPKAR